MVYNLRGSGGSYFSFGMPVNLLARAVKTRPRSVVACFALQRVTTVVSYSNSGLCYVRLLLAVLACAVKAKSFDLLNMGDLDEISLAGELS